MKNLILFFFLFVFAEIISAQVIQPAPADNQILDAYANHPHLKLLGASLEHPGLKELYHPGNTAKESCNDGKKSIYTNYYDTNKGVYLIPEENLGLIRAIYFVTEKRKKAPKIYKKHKVYEEDLPEAIDGVEVKNTYDSPFSYKGYILDEYVLNVHGEKAKDDLLETTLAARKNSGKKWLIQSKEDLKRYADPKGKDIWKLVGSRDELFSKYVYSERVRRFGTLSKNWDDNIDLYLSDRNFLFNPASNNYIIKRGANADDLRERLPFHLDNVKFDLGTFLPQVFALPEFASARYGNEDGRMPMGKKVSYTVIELKFRTSYGDRFIVIKKYPDERGDRFSKMTFQSYAHSGYASTQLGPLILDNNPWKTHHETIVRVNQSSKDKYVSAFTTLFNHMEQEFENLKLQADKLESSKLRDISFLANKILAEEQASFLVKYHQGASYLQVNVPEKIKDEIFSTLVNQQRVDGFMLTPGGVENESLYGKCILVEKANQIAGVLQFHKFKDEFKNNYKWSIRIYPFNEDDFKKDLAQIFVQGHQDDYRSWKTGSPKSSHTMYKALSSRIDYVDNNEKLFVSAYNELPVYVLEKALAYVPKGFGLGLGGSIEELFILPEKNHRILKYEYKGTSFMLSLMTQKNSSGYSSRILISHGKPDKYKNVTEENTIPKTPYTFLQDLMETYEEKGYELIWTSTYGESGFAEDIITNFEGGNYHLIVAYNEKDGTPPAGITIEYGGKRRTFPATDPDLPPIGGVNAIGFGGDIPKELNKFRIHGGYHGIHSKKEIHAALVKKVEK